MDTTSPNAPAPRRVNFWLKLNRYQRLFWAVCIEMPLLFGTIFGLDFLIVKYTPALQRLLFGGNSTQLLLSPYAQPVAIFSGMSLSFAGYCVIGSLFIHGIAIFSPHLAEDLKYKAAAELKISIKYIGSIIKSTIIWGIPRPRWPSTYTVEIDALMRQRDPELLEWSRKKNLQFFLCFLVIGIPFYLLAVNLYIRVSPQGISTNGHFQILETRTPWTNIVNAELKIDDHTTKSGVTSPLATFILRTKTGKEIDAWGGPGLGSTSADDLIRLVGILREHSIPIKVRWLKPSQRYILEYENLYQTFMAVKQEIYRTGPVLTQ